MGPPLALGRYHEAARTLAWRPRRRPRRPPGRPRRPLRRRRRLPPRRNRARHVADRRPAWRDGGAGAASGTAAGRTAGAAFHRGLQSGCRRIPVSGNAGARQGPGRDRSTWHRRCCWRLLRPNELRARLARQPRDRRHARARPGRRHPGRRLSDRGRARIQACGLVRIIRGVVPGRAGRRHAGRRRRVGEAARALPLHRGRGAEDRARRRRGEAGSGRGEWQPRLDGAPVRARWHA